MSKRYSGFTLTELMITIAVVGILASLAMPSFSEMIKNNRLAININDLTSDLALARSEAAKRGYRVTICTSSGGGNCSGSLNWALGRMVFVDQNGDGVVGAGDEILRVSSALTGSNTLSFVDGTPASLAYIQYRPKGITDTVGTFRLCDNRVGAYGRSIDISNTGRASLTTQIACP